MLLITETQNAPITKPNIAVIKPPTLKLILLGIGLTGHTQEE